MDKPSASLRTRILLHMNAWGKRANIQFVASNTDPKTRIARLDSSEGGGCWSYVGTDVLSISKNEPTMNLEGFTIKTSEEEFRRVVRHETGHTLGFPHEHMRRELVIKINPQKAIEYYSATQGWSEAEVRQQVLTPIEEFSIRAHAYADPDSIMCYHIPGMLTWDGQSILGGRDINARDYAFAGKIYPKEKKNPLAKAARRKHSAAKHKAVRLTPHKGK